MTAPAAFEAPKYGPAFSFLRSLWLRVPRPVRYRVWKIAGPGVQKAYTHFWLARPALKRPHNPDAPLVVAGLFSTANGIGEAARSTYRSLEAAGLSPIAVDLSAQLAPVDMFSDIPCQQMPADREGTLILQLNGPEIPAALQHLGMKRGRHWFTVGYWAWELPTFPASWDRAFSFVSELWTISTFSADALKSHRRAPGIHIFPHAVTPPQDIATDRAQFDWPEDAFVFLTMVDSMSSMARKNPFAAIRAFRSAFANDPGHLLVVKTRNLDRAPNARQDLEAVIGTAQNIRVFDASLSDAKRWELIQAADSVVSLHRSEGFGLVLAEAMALGKPVIATDWSGNMDFTCEDTAFLVRSELIPCHDVYGVYQDTSASWASASEAEASRQMQQVVADSDARVRKSNAARIKLASWASLEGVGSDMARHLSAVQEPPVSQTG